MLVPGSVNPLLLSGSAAATGYQISRSLRFNSSDSAYCGRTFVTPTTQSIFTFSAWIKRSALGAVQRLFGASTNHTFGFTSGDALNLTFGGVSALTTTAVFRDPSAWYHVVWTQNGTAHTVYVNGSSVGTATATSSVFNTAIAHQIGAGNTTNFLSGYLTEIHFIDGVALTPTSFGEFDTNDIWQPKQYTGTYGTNGFKLNFSDNSTAAALGTDTSGNGNTWTVNNISPGSTYGITWSSTNPLYLTTTPYAAFDANDSTPVGLTVGGSLTVNFSPGVPVTSNVQILTENNTYITGARINGGTTVSNPNTSATAYWTLNFSGTMTSLQVFTSGAGTTQYWYDTKVDGNYLVIVNPKDNDSLVDVPTNGSQTDTGVGGEVRGNYCTLNPVVGGANSAQITFANGNLEATWSTTAGYAVTLGTIGVSSGKWYWETTYASGIYALFGVATASSSLTNYIGSEASSYSYYSLNGNKYNNNTASAYGSAYAINDVIGIALDLDNGKIYFSKNGTWQNSGSPTGGTGAAYSGLAGTFFPAYADATTTSASSYVANFGQRPFAYTAPSGFKALCSTNLPAPVVTKPSTAMDVALYTGNGSTQTISGLGFSPDLVWIKGRSAATIHNWMDTVRGATIRLNSSSTAAEVTDSNGLTAFTSDGFSLGTDNAYNGNTSTYAAWCWDAGTSNVVNTQGSITSTVRANPSAGFSIVTYTGTGANATVGHGLGVAPQMLIVKRRNVGDDWTVWHTSISATQFLQLNATAAATTDATRWNSTAPASTVFSIGTNTSTNASTSTYVAYCFAPVAGYSAFGSYTSNGANDGPFIYTGFAPEFILVKSTTSATSWVIKDSRRPGYNVAAQYLAAEASAAEATVNNTDVDFLSNGFKWRAGGAASITNNSTVATYIYAAFSEVAFNFARAR